MRSISAYTKEIIIFRWWKKLIRVFQKYAWSNVYNVWVRLLHCICNIVQIWPFATNETYINGINEFSAINFLCTFTFNSNYEIPIMLAQNFSHVNGLSEQGKFYLMNFIIVFFVCNNRYGIEWLYIRIMGMFESNLL